MAEEPEDDPSAAAVWKGIVYMYEVERKSFRRGLRFGVLSASTLIVVAGLLARWCGG